MPEHRPLPKFIGLVEQKDYGSSIVWFDEMTGLSRDVCLTVLGRMSGDFNGRATFMVVMMKRHIASSRPAMISNPLAIILRNMLGSDACFEERDRLIVTPRGCSMLRMALRYDGAE